MSKLTQHSPGLCAHCYCEKSVHKPEMMNCPRTPGVNCNKWVEKKFENLEWMELATAATDMLAILQQCLSLVTDLNSGHLIVPTSGAKQDIIQRIKAMQPRIYNLIKPLQH